MMDVSTLGKIDVQGPDAAIFLDRLYTNTMSTLGVGKARYGLMCRLDGIIFDDGVVMRLAPDRFFVTTTTGHAAAVLEWMEEWLQTEWPGLRVWPSSITEQWASVAVVGPKARAVMASLAPDLNVSREGFPFMAVRRATVAGIAAAQVARVSFSGELAYEVSVPATLGHALWESIRDAGEPLGMQPYGMDALHVLRAEKGYLIVGQETDGMTTPFDAGLGWMVAKHKDFIGKRSLARPDMQRPDRLQLVGFLPVEPNTLVPDGAGLVADPSQPTPMTVLGHVTASHYSPTLGRTFGLAMVKGGSGRHGEVLHAPLGNRSIAVTITDFVLYDKAGAKRDG
jgi:sarcosine oxidase subunit alpha